MAEAFPNRIRELRNQRGWKQHQLGERSGCGISQISDLETGRRELTIHWMRVISRAFGVEPADLLLPQDNSRSLDAGESALLDRYRRAGPEQREQMLRMAEIIVPDEAKRAQG